MGQLIMMKALILISLFVVIASKHVHQELDGKPALRNPLTAQEFSNRLKRSPKNKSSEESSEESKESSEESNETAETSGDGAVDGSDYEEFEKFVNQREKRSPMKRNKNKNKNKKNKSSEEK